MNQQKMAFFGLCLGFFIAMMDTTTVPLIYISLIAEFEVTPAMAAWVNNSYLITYAGFLLLGGRLGDAYNRKNLIVSALIILSVGALISGCGQTLMQVIAGRALMGVGAGLLTPQSMAYISIIFAQGGRGTALGIWGAVAGIATATGPVVTQLFLQIADWRWVMWINIPIALLGLGIITAYLPAAPGKGLKGREVLVNGAFGFSLAAVILGLQLIHSAEGINFATILLLVLGGVIAIWLLLYELRHRAECILPTSIWQDRTFLRTCLVSGFLGFGLTAFYLPLAFLIEIRMNFGSIAISIIMITIALANALIGPIAGHFSDRMAPEVIVRYGLFAFALAVLLIGGIGIFATGGSIAFIGMIIAMALAGAGTGLAFAPLANLALSRAVPIAIGRAAAFFNGSRQLMSALGSVVVAVLFDYVVSQSRLEGASQISEKLQPYSPVVACAALACFLLIALCLGTGAWLSRRHSSNDQNVTQS
ncbi:MFS transporter [Photorhabdus heterorhabditis]|uniref:MFS transporter n=1 Tax=Photorhabdus heterorhabditis TaxID=880156 RepID=A0A5B0X8R1_9GAMM|nr:MFS transporter [Photorhabdus heterorhabditis]KAA1195703.1 MFS transporter [Photorhabdus heterorhabditis]